MQWIAPSEKDLATDTLEKRLWSAANQLWAGAGLKQSDYSEPILGLIFLRFAEVRFAARRAVLEQAGTSARRGSKVDDSTAYHAEGVLFLPEGARFAELLQLPEGTDIGKAVNAAMKAIERDNPHMAGVLPKGYRVFDSLLLSNLLKTLSTIPADLAGDAFGKIYEYFLGTFAMSEGQKGGEFFTPTEVGFLIAYMDADVRQGNIMRNPLFVNEDGSLRRFHKIAASPMWNQEVPAAIYENDSDGRFACYRTQGCQGNNRSA